MLDFKDKLISKAFNMKTNKIDTNSKPEPKNFGVLYTGYLDKKQPTYMSTRFKSRFVVLTQEAVHWFKRDEGYDLFGEERGHVSLKNIDSCRILDEDTCQFELKSTGNVCRYFKAPTQSSCEEWVR